MQTLPYFQNPEEMNGLISTVQLPAGLPVAKSLAVMPENFRLADVNFEVVSIPVEPVSAVGGQIHIGQRVNLYQMMDQDEFRNRCNRTNPKANKGCRSSRLPPASWL